MDFLEGAIVAIDKPYGMSSFGALAHVRYVLSKHVGVKRVKTGHAGTLDPLATGVLVLCTGKMTKQIERLQYETKEYTATLQLGATTASYDREHTVDMTYPTRHITRELIDSVLPQFLGDVMQVPPAYSAVHVDGERAYKLRRQSHEVEKQMQAKPVRIDEIEVLDFDAQTDAVATARGMWQGHLHPLVGPRHRSCAGQRGFPDRTAPHARGRYPRGGLRGLRPRQGMAGGNGVGR